MTTLVSACLSLALLLSVSCIMPSSREPGTETVTQQTCSLAVRSSRSLALSDGRTLHVAAKTGAYDGARILIAGTPVITWNAGVTATANDIVGAVLDTTGLAVPVPNPRVGRSPTDLRVAVAAQGGWHVVFIDTTGNRQAEVGPLDSAAVWYGRFDGARWHDLAQVASVTNAYLNIDLSSDLRADGDRLRFAFGFDGDSSRSKSPGVIMLRRDAGQWRADTLYTRFHPSHVQLGPASRTGSWPVAIVRAHFDEKGGRSSSLFFTEYDSSWTEPRVIATGDSMPISRPSIDPIADGLMLTWRRRSGALIEAVQLNAPDPQRVMRVLDGTQYYGTIALDASTLVWHTAASRDSIRAVMYRGNKIVNLNPAPVNHDSFLHLGIAVSMHEFVLFTSRIGRSSEESPAITMVSRLAIACDAALQ